MSGELAQPLHCAKVAICLVASSPEGPGPHSVSMLLTYFRAIAVSLHLCESNGLVFMWFQKLRWESDLQLDAKVLAPALGSLEHSAVNNTNMTCLKGCCYKVQVLNEYHSWALEPYSLGMQFTTINSLLDVGGRE